MSRVAKSAALGVALTLLAPAAPAFGQAAPVGLSTDVLARTVQRGELLSAGDFTVEDIAVTRARDAVSAREAAGFEARRTLRVGAPVRAADLIEPRAVRRGEQVKIALRSGSLLITATGRALGDAAVGEPVRVFSETTNQTLDAVAEGTGAVRIAIP